MDKGVLFCEGCGLWAEGGVRSGLTTENAYNLQAGMRMKTRRRLKSGGVEGKDQIVQFYIPRALAFGSSKVKVEKSLMRLARNDSGESRFKRIARMDTDGKRRVK